MKTMGISAPSVARKTVSPGRTRADNLKPNTRRCEVQPVSKAPVTLPKLTFKTRKDGT